MYLYAEVRDLLPALPPQARRPPRERVWGERPDPEVRSRAGASFSGSGRGRGGRLPLVAGQGLPSRADHGCRDSSAGGLAAATMLKLRDDGAPLPGGGVMISRGWTLPAPARAGHARRRGPHGHQVEPRAHGRPVPRRRGPPHRSLTLYADLSGLPPLLMVVGGDEACSTTRQVPEGGGSRG